MAVKRDKTGKSKVLFRAKEIVSFKYCAKKWEFDKIFHILQQYRRGMSIDEISKAYGYKVKYINKILKDFKFITGNEK